MFFNKKKKKTRVVNSIGDICLEQELYKAINKNTTKANDRNIDVPLVFELDVNQVKILKKWKLKHKKCKSDTVFTKYEYKFIPTGLGCISEVKCLDCNKKIDLTGEF